MLRLFPALLLLALSVPLAAGISVGPARVDADLPVEIPSAVEAPLEETALPIAPIPLPSFTHLPAATLPGPAPEPAPGPRDLLDITPQLPSTLPRAAAPAPLLAQPEPAATAAGLVVLGFLLYSRLSPNALLENERRERILGIVRGTPGIGPQAVGEALGTSWGVTQYHLDKLEKAGLLTSQRSGHHRCYFLPGAVPREKQQTVVLFRVDTTRRVAELVREKPGLTQTQLCAELGLSASAMSKQVSRLESAGLLRREAGEGAARLFPMSA